MMKKLMSLGLVGILSASLMVGCSSNNDSKDDDTVTIKYVDQNGNVKREKVTKEEAKKIEQNQKQQTNDTTKKQTTQEQPKKESKQHEDSTTNDHNYDDELYGNAARGTCPDCGRTAMVFNHGNGLKCAYCGFYDDGYFLDEEEPDPSYSDNKEDDYTPEDNSDDYDYDDSQDYEEPEIDNDVEESPSEAVDPEEEILP